MACEDALAGYIQAVDSVARLAAQLQEFARTLGTTARERPMTIVGGEVNSWRRYALEAERAAVEQRQALERFLEAALRHEDPSGAGP